MNLASLMPGPVDQDELSDTGQITILLINSAWVNQRHATGLNLLQKPGGRIHPVPAYLLGSIPQNIQYHPPGIRPLREFLEMCQ